jgi:uncharacterized repeat protein (TIGR03803 family)
MRSFIAVTAAVALCLAAGAFAQTYTVLHEFGVVPDDGYSAHGGPVSDGVKLYGLTFDGGTDDGGVIYSMNLDGSGYAILHSFDLDDDPTPGLALANGVLYGTTEQGGADDMGMIYSIKTDGSDFIALYSFPAGPWGNLYPSPVIASGDTLYGQLMHDPSIIPPPRDPAIPGPSDWGVVYSITTAGTGFTVLTNFVGSPDDGEDPVGKLLLEDGALYGATMYGGTYYVDAGTLYSLPVAGGAHAILHNFSGNDGFGPMGALVSDGSRLYGMTSTATYSYYGYGGAGSVFAIDKNGSNFKTLHTFNSGSGTTPGKGRPYSDYLSNGLARDGNRLFGATFSIGIAATRSIPLLTDVDMGTLFSINTDTGGFSELYRFDGLIGGTGSGPLGIPLILNGTLYGTTLGGGAEDDGVVYSFTIPPAPPIDLTPNKTAFFSTDYIAVRADVAAIATPCLPVVRIVRPGGGAYYVVQGQGITEAPTPFLGSLTPVTVPAPIYDYPVYDGQFRGMPTGSYLLQGFAVDATQPFDPLNPALVGSMDSQTLVIQ